MVQAVIKIYKIMETSVKYQIDQLLNKNLLDLDRRISKKAFFAALPYNAAAGILAVLLIWVPLPYIKEPLVGVSIFVLALLAFVLFMVWIVYRYQKKIFRNLDWEEEYKREEWIELDKLLEQIDEN